MYHRWKSHTFSSLNRSGNQLQSEFYQVYKKGSIFKIYKYIALINSSVKSRIFTCSGEIQIWKLYVVMYTHFLRIKNIFNKASGAWFQNWISFH